MVQMAPYVTIKNIEIALATKFSSPTSTKAKAIRMVTRELLKGSFDTGFPLANQVFTNLVGNTLSRPMACRVLGATIIEPRADEREAAANPIGIIGPQTAILCIIIWSLASSCGVAEMLNL